jgi:hypothetical protein
VAGAGTGQFLPPSSEEARHALTLCNSIPKLCLRLGSCCRASKPMVFTDVLALIAECARQVCMVLRYVADEITQYNDDIGVSLLCSCQVASDYRFCSLLSRVPAGCELACPLTQQHAGPRVQLSLAVADSPAACLDTRRATHGASCSPASRAPCPTSCHSWNGRWRQTLRRRVRRVRRAGARRRGSTCW